MKKYLPLILLGVGLVVAVVAFIIFRSMSSNSVASSQQQESVPELAQSEWPVVSLVPTNNPKVKGSDGHWLDFMVQKINVPGASTMDYLLVYSTSDGGQQGVPGSIKLTGESTERKLLLGSESSGKFRYDAGVERGTLTITFRDANGKSMGKLSTDFHLQSGVTTLTSVDGKFTYTLDKVAKDVFFVTMQTFLTPDPAVVVFSSNGYSVFASDGKPHTGR